MPAPSVLQGVAAGGLRRGFDRLANLLALTLGPTQGVVLSTPLGNPAGRPELLTDGATIARRLMQLPDRAEDVGAMLLRNLVWRMHREAGDGSATAAVLAQALLAEAGRYTAAGGNVMDVRRGLAAAVSTAAGALQAQARMDVDAVTLAALARGVTGDDELGGLLGEMFSRLGAHAHIIVEEYMARYMAVDYHEGGRFTARLASPYFQTDAVKARAVQPETYVVLVDGELNAMDDVQPALEMVMQTELRRVLFVAHDIRGDALNMLVMNHQQGALPLMAAGLRRAGEKRASDLADLAALTGATVLSAETGRGARAIQPGDFGSAQRVEANADELVVVAFGQHSPAAQAHAAALRARAADPQIDDDARAELRFRLARMSGAVATLKIGAATESERATLKQKAERAIRALPWAMREGTVPGGGAAYLACADAVRAAGQNAATDGERMAHAALARALEAPLACIAQNAGGHPGAMLAEARRAGRGCGYDAVARQIADMRVAGILDAAGILRLALETAVSGAVMALTTDTIVLHASPQVSYEP